jgi:hypothetical protein
VGNQKIRLEFWHFSALLMTIASVFRWSMLLFSCPEVGVEGVNNSYLREFSRGLDDNLNVIVQAQCWLTVSLQKMAPKKQCNGILYATHELQRQVGQ